MPIAEITAALAGLKSATEIGKVLVDISKGMDQAELKLKIIELVGKLHEVTVELNELKSSMALQEAMTFREAVYWKEGEDAPYCPKCFDVHRKAVHLQNPMPHYYQCFECHHKYPNAKHEPPPRRQRKSYPIEGKEAPEFG